MAEMPGLAISRRRALGVLVGAGAMAALPARAEPFAGHYALRPEPLADGIWVVRGADEPIAFGNGGAIANATILKTDHGAILYDCGPSLAYGRALAATARALTGGPVLRVLLSHLHPDHAMGAAAFSPDTLAALPETRAEIARDGAGFADAMYRILADWMSGTSVVLPGIALAPGPIEIGGRKLVLHALSGHSAADLVVVDEASGTMIAGDLVFYNRAPATPDADLPQWQRSLDALAAIPHRALVPGHGPVDAGGQAAIAQTRDWLNWLDTALHKAVADGLDMGEAGDISIPDHFAGIKLARYELQRSVSHFYARIEAQALPRVDTNATSGG